MKVSITSTMLIGVTLLFAVAAGAQDRSAGHGRRWAPPEPGLFHSPHVAHLETAATIRPHTLEFQYYDRLLLPISSGYDDFYGLDGHRALRVGFAFGATERLMLALGRSNVTDNVDFHAKYRLIDRSGERNALSIAALAGAAWNTTVPGRDDGDDANFQYYAQAIANLMVGDVVGFGVVPSYLYNSSYLSDPYEETWAIGAYGQVYLSQRFSTFVEWNHAFDGFQRVYDNWTLGVEVKVGGHFFKGIVTNTLVLNLPHFIPGATEPFDDIDRWHFGGNLTRLFSL